MHANTNPEEDLNAALDMLHLVFGSYRGSDVWDDPLDQLTELERSAPKRLSVHELSDEQVDYFFSHAVCQFSQSDQQKLQNQIAATKHFLPFSTFDNIGKAQMTRHFRGAKGDTK